MSYLDWAESQLAELELLTSMFPSREELEIVDHMAVAELRDFVEGSSPSDRPPPSRPRFLLTHKLDAELPLDVVLSCSYPSEYPGVIPEITVRCAGLCRSQQTQLHASLNAYLAANCLGEVCVLSAVDWVKDNLRAFLSESSPAAPKKETTSEGEAFSRLWIYSHHIYNPTKRKSIQEWSRGLGLSGFCMPGKPGVVCVEGPQPACEEFWSRVKALTWKRIMIRHREDVPGADIDSLRKFTGFEEAVFDPRGARRNHMDLGLLYQYLSERGCCDVFQMYFGIEGRRGQYDP